MKYIVAYGEMFDSINFIGPFDTFDEAEVWADFEIASGSSWWVLGMEKPLDSSIPQE